ncbi:hypothetical protein GOP47_0011738 [Adiantum capillus-veneris]|uniref:ENTH domain-containing protein n=1 Tax=Adiantum capillus-veneris TaxID=13818 RepID=A0A9D4UTB4_ADICA|nr:hypothetical protein GOP47_0011738 [Adiantum capillus-veneris]
MAQFSLRDFKKQASFFLRERLNDARLALTDVSRIQLLTEEATNEDPWGPETKTMATLADAAFELEEYERIVQVIHNRLDGSKQRPWRQLYKTLVLLEYLLTHGPTSIGKEFGGDMFCIEDLSQFNLTDQQGIERGLMVRKTACRVLELLNNPDLWKEERARARKLSFGIRGFGSSMSQVSLQDPTHGEEESSADILSSLLTNKASASTDVCSVPSDEELSSLSFQPKQNSFTKDHNISGQPFKKSLSSLSYLRERLPHLSRQTVGNEDDKSELEEVSIGLLGGEENVEDASRQGAVQGESLEVACRLVTC